MQTDRAYESDTRTWQELQRVEGFPEHEIQRRMIDEALALTSQILVRRGHREEAEAMLRVVRHEIGYYRDFGTDYAQLWLEHEPGDAPLFMKHERRIQDVFSEVVERRQYGEEMLNSVQFREALPVVTFGWREQLAQILHGKQRSNHARRAREEDPRWTEDGLHFTNSGELRLYRELKKWQENVFGERETIAVFPLSKGRIRGATREPDFLVTYKGKVAVLELDGPHHNARRAHDMSREQLFEDAGIALVYRISVESLDSPEELKGHLERFFHRLRDR